MPVSRKRSATYVALGLEETVAYYNAQESVDGQWYVFIIDENQTIIAHAPNPDLVGKHVSQALGPNSYPTGSAVAASADQDGAWFDYTYPNPASGVVETKHSWVVLHDGITFGSGWYERGPGKSDAPAYTKAFVRQAMNLVASRRPTAVAGSHAATRRASSAGRKGCTASDGRRTLRRPRNGVWSRKPAASSGTPLRGDAALEPGQRLAVGALGAWREALDPAAGEIESDQLREGGGGGHGDMDARGRAGVKSRERLATRRGAS